MSETRCVGPALSAADLLRGAAVAGAGLLLCAALLLGLRRVAGALALPLATPALLLVAVLVAAAAIAVRLARRVAGRPQRVDPIAAIVSVSVVLLGLSVSLPGTSWTGLTLFWLIVGSEEVGAWRHGWRRIRWKSRPAPIAPVSVPHEPVAQAIDEVEPRSLQAEREDAREAAGDVLAGLLVDEEEPPADEVLQQLTRSRTADGSETLAGWLRVAVATGQRSANVHVAFCPPFARTPQVSVEQLDGPETRIKVVQVLPYGVRCDLKLTGGVCDVPAMVLLQLSVCAASVSEHKPAGDAV